MANANDVRAGGAYVEVRADTSKVAKDVDKGVLDELKHGLGGRSEFKEMFEVLKGGGALVGLSLAAEAIKGLAEGATKFKEALADADKNAADVAQSFMRSVPVLSQIEGAGAAINEMITGRQAKIDEELKQVAEINRLLQVQADIRAAMAKAAEGHAEALRKLNGEADLIGKVDPERTQIQYRLTRDEQTAAAEARRKAAIDALKAAAEVEVADPTGAKRKVPVIDPAERKRMEAEVAQLDAEIPRDSERLTKQRGQGGVMAGIGQSYVDASVLPAEKSEKEIEGMKKRRDELAEELNLAKQAADAYDQMAKAIDAARDAEVSRARDNYAASMAELARRQKEEYDQESDRIRERQGEQDDARRQAQAQGQGEVENDIANRRQAVIDSVKPKGERFADEQNYLESLGVSGNDLERALRQAREDIFGQPVGAVQFGGAGAELLGGSGVQERIAMATEATAKGVKKLASPSGGGLTFR